MKQALVHKIYWQLRRMFFGVMTAQECLRQARKSAELLKNMLKEAK